MPFTFRLSTPHRGWLLPCAALLLLTACATPAPAPELDGSRALFASGRTEEGLQARTVGTQGAQCHQAHRQVAGQAVAVLGAEAGGGVQQGGQAHFRAASSASM